MGVRAEDTEHDTSDLGWESHLQKHLRQLPLSTNQLWLSSVPFASVLSRQDGDLKAIDFDSACTASGGMASRDLDVAERVGSRFDTGHVLTPRYGTAVAPPRSLNVQAVRFRSISGIEWRSRRV